MTRFWKWFFGISESVAFMANLYALVRFFMAPLNWLDSIGLAAITAHFVGLCMLESLKWKQYTEINNGE